MRNLLSIAFLAIFFLTSAMVFKASNIEKADQILGDWKPSNGRSIIRIYKGVKDNGEDPKKYYGKIIWLLEPNDANGNPRTDINNSDDAKKKNKLKGLVNVKELEFVGNDQEWLWENGTIYDPNNGSEYSFKAEINRKKPNQLLGKGYIGVSLFGREDVWTRMVKK